tara:strand:- start:107 stop:412 length:306 start_codon:yes stop_codon:yes gene_type:complete
MLKDILKIGWGMNFDSVTAKRAMEVMSDEDLAFIAAYYPMMLQSMCVMATLEDQLESEGKDPGQKIVIAEPGKPKNLFLYLWSKFKQWLFFKFGKTGSIEK